jgi:predicted ATPase with chaperone activity
MWRKCVNFAPYWNRDYRKLDESGDSLVRAIADLAGSDQIQTPHVVEALQYQPKGMIG